MILKDQLTELKSNIKLTEDQAHKRDFLESFIDDKKKALLLDADSLLFTAIYKVVDFKEIRKLIRLHGKEAAKACIIEAAFDRFDAQMREIIAAIELDGFEVDEVVYFFTTCKHNFRKDIDHEYKANRKRNKWIKELKTYTINYLRNWKQQVHTSDMMEADDLISMVYRNSNVKESLIIASPDKDLKQIPAVHFDYFKRKVYDEQTGEEFRIFKGWSHTSEDEGHYMLCKQLLIGDNSDNIKGVYGIGEKKSTKLLADRNKFGRFRAVVESYNDNQRLRMNLKLIKL